MGQGAGASLAPGVFALPEQWPAPASSVREWGGAGVTGASGPWPVHVNLHAE